MTEEATTPPDGEDSAPLAGERLAAARAAREISIGDIARQLHLDEHKVRSLEQNDFEILGAPVFAKGYLRKYAEIVGVPIDDILADYYRLNRATGAPLVIPRRAKPPRDISLGPLLGTLAVIVIVAGAAWWWLSTDAEWFDQEAGPATLAPFADDRTAGPQPVAEQAEPAPVEQNEEPVPAGEEAGGDVTPPEPVATARPQAETPGDGFAEVELRVTFSGDCWTEVTDAAGDRLYFGLGTEGRSVTVNGEPPLQVLLGNSANASLTVNGSNYPVPRSAQRGDTARLTIVNL